MPGDWLGAIHNPKESNEVLRGAIVNQDYCNSLYNEDITDQMICTGYEEGGKDACQNDSDGPLSIEIKKEGIQLIGVVWHGWR